MREQKSKEAYGTTERPSEPGTGLPFVFIRSSSFLPASPIRADYTLLRFLLCSHKNSLEPLSIATSLDLSSSDLAGTAGLLKKTNLTKRAQPVRLRLVYLFTE